MANPIGIVWASSSHSEMLLKSMFKEEGAEQLTGVLFGWQVILFQPVLGETFNEELARLVSSVEGIRRLIICIEKDATEFNVQAFKDKNISVVFCRIQKDGNHFFDLEQALKVSEKPFDFDKEIPKVLRVLEERFPGRTWKCKEIGDGNVNYIYLVTSERRETFIVKQALDFARCNPEAFPLTSDRLLFESRAFDEYSKCAKQFVPKIHGFSSNEAMLIMEYLTPHKVLRVGLNEGKFYPFLGRHLGEFLAKTLFQTSKYALDCKTWEENVAFFKGNSEMRQIILDLNFTHPFYGSKLNQYAEGLEALVRKIQEDPDIRKVVDRLKQRFLNNPEALAHGDLHTGSLLVTEEDTKVFDPEFTTHAPIAFDIGMLLGNFLMAAVAANAHGGDQASLARTTKEIWDVFASQFPRKDLLPQIWEETQQLMGVEIVRRIIGVAHISDFETIADSVLKLECERKALTLAIRLIVGPSLADSNALEQFINQE